MHSQRALLPLSIPLLPSRVDQALAIALALFCLTTAAWFMASRRDALGALYALLVLALIVRQYVTRLRQSRHFPRLLLRGMNEVELVDAVTGEVLDCSIHPDTRIIGRWVFLVLESAEQRYYFYISPWAVDAESLRQLRVRLIAQAIHAKAPLPSPRRQTVSSSGDRHA